jgi:hypothetical protein
MAYEGMINAGLVYFDKFDANGDATGFKLIGNCTGITVTNQGTTITQKSRMIGTYGQALATVTLPDETLVSVAFDTIDATNIAYALMGTEAAHSVTGTTVTDEAATAPSALGLSIQLANPYDISSLTITSTGTSPTTYTSGTDFEIANARNGLVSFPVGSTITPKQPLLIDYTYGTQSGDTVSSNTVTELDGNWLIDLSNLATSKYSTVSFRAVLRSSSAIDLLAQDFQPVTLEGTVIGEITYTLKD